MDLANFKGEKFYTFSSKRNIFLFAVLMLPVFFVFMSVIGISEFKILALVAGAILLLALLGFETMLFIVIFSLHLRLFLSGIHVSIFLIYLLFISYIINYQSFRVLKIPFFTGFLVYFLTIIPSFYNTVNLVKSLYFLQNLIIIFLLACILYNYIDNFQKIKRIFYFLVTISSLNALYIIAFGIINNRRFMGFAGLEYVEYLSLIAAIFLMSTILLRKSKKILPLIFSFIFLAAMVITQTRNIFLSLSLTLILFVLFITTHSSKYNLKNKRILFGLVLFAGFAIVIFLNTNILKSNTFERFGQLGEIKAQQIENEEDFGSNSLFTRLLLWHTAYKAFTVHPYIGIGAYSFPFSSNIYHELPPELFEEFVKGLAPHVTYFAVLTETGIVGMAGFALFLFVLIRLSYKNLRLAESSEEIFYSTIVSFSEIYIILAMFVTDAWLRGQCGLLWGIVLGCLAGTNKILNNKKEQVSYINS